MGELRSSLLQTDASRNVMHELNEVTGEQLCYPKLDGRVIYPELKLVRMPWKLAINKLAKCVWTNVSSGGNLCFWRALQLILREAEHPDAGKTPEALKGTVCDYAHTYADVIASEVGMKAHHYSQKVGQDGKKGAMATEVSVIAAAHKYAITIGVMDERQQQTWCFVPGGQGPRGNISFLWLQNHHFHYTPAVDLQQVGLQHGLETNFLSDEDSQALAVAISGGGRKAGSSLSNSWATINA
eukprot:1857352-Amphidinium_carterae.4